MAGAAGKSKKRNCKEEELRLGADLAEDIVPELVVFDRWAAGFDGLDGLDVAGINKRALAIKLAMGLWLLGRIIFARCRLVRQGKSKSAPKVRVPVRRADEVALLDCVYARRRAVSGANLDLAIKSLRSKRLDRAEGHFIVRCPNTLDVIAEACEPRLGDRERFRGSPVA